MDWGHRKHLRGSHHFRRHIQALCKTPCIRTLRTCSGIPEEDQEGRGNYKLLVRNMNPSAPLW